MVTSGVITLWKANITGSDILAQGETRAKVQ